MASTRLLLRGAPDASIGTAEAKNNGLQVMQLEMTQEVIDGLLESVRSGKPPQILFGRAPQLRYGDKTHVLEPSTESLRHELYRKDDDGQFKFTGLINHTLAVRSAEQITAGVDTALENLKNSMATLTQEREARQAIVDNTPMFPHHRRNMSSGRSNHRALLNPNSHIRTPNRSLPSSPALGASASPSAGTHPTSTYYQDSAKMAAIRKTVVHIIAVEPKQAAVITRLTKSSPDETKQILDRIASNGVDGYKLLDRAYKELDPWSFPYKSDDEREAAVENAIKAYDRMRMSKDDPLWQKLLPKEERGKGKCLSRLKINAPSQAPAAAPLNLKKTEKKDSTAKKAEAKKPAAAEESEKKIKEKDPIIRKVTKKIDSVMNSMGRAKKEVKRPAKKNAAASEPVRAPLQKQKKETTKPPPSSLAKSPTKPLTNKPKTPSPLSASPPVNASDFEDDHPVHKALSAAASPTKASTSSSDRPLKYRLEQSEKRTAPAKQRKAGQERTPVNGFRPGTGSASSSAEKKRKIADIDHSDRGSTPHKKRHLDLINTAAASPHGTHSHPHSQKMDTSTSPSSSSPTSPLLPLTYQQTIALSQKFHVYYERYYKLHTQLNQSDRPPTKQQRDDLWRMHEMVAKMKEEIRVGAQRQH